MDKLEKRVNDLSLDLSDEKDETQKLKRRVEALEKFRIETVAVVDKLTTRLTEAETKIKEIKTGIPLPRRMPGT